MSDIAEKFWSAPPVSRTLVAAMFVESALVLSGLVSGYSVVFFPSHIFKFPPELWRLMSSFLLTSSGIGFVFDLYFTWMYGTGLELNSPRFNQPGDFFIYICFVATIILVCQIVKYILLFYFYIQYTSHFCPHSLSWLKWFLVTRKITLMAHATPSFAKTPRTACGMGMVVAFLRMLCVISSFTYSGCSFLHSYSLSCDVFMFLGLPYMTSTNKIKATAGFLLGSVIFTQALILAMIYTFAQDNRGTKAHFIIVQIPIELLPWAMLILTLVLNGFPAALSQGMGIVAAHLYDFLTRLYPTFQGGQNFIQTPNAIRQYFSRGQERSTSKAYGQAIRPSQPTQQPQSRGWASGLSNNWNGRGTGRRLGGD